MPSAVALVPARAGSSRVRDKNIRYLAGHPLLAYTIAAARRSGVFDTVVVSTDSADYAEVARHYGAETPFLRPAEMATDASPDIEWIGHALDQLEQAGHEFEVFSILRPTSPFRRAETIVDAMETFLADPDADSLRAVEPVSQHPGKMWRMEGSRLVPLLRGERDGVPWHSTPTQFLPEVWVQNASLEIAWTRCVHDDGTIAGETIVAFHHPPPGGMDVNRPEDWDRVERLAADHPDLLPAVDVAPPTRTRPETATHG